MRSRGSAGWFGTFEVLRFRRLTVWNLRGLEVPQVDGLEPSRFCGCGNVSLDLQSQALPGRTSPLLILHSDTSNFQLLTSLTSISDNFLDFRCEPDFSIPEWPNVRTSKVPNLRCVEPPKCRTSKPPRVGLSNV